jgi:hypothetical protein
MSPGTDETMENDMIFLQAIKNAKTLSYNFMVNIYVIHIGDGQYDARHGEAAVMLYGDNPNYVAYAFAGELQTDPPDKFYG